MKLTEIDCTKVPVLGTYQTIQDSFKFHLKLSRENNQGKGLCLPATSTLAKIMGVSSLVLGGLGYYMYSTHKSNPPSRLPPPPVDRTFLEKALAGLDFTIRAITPEMSPLLGIGVVIGCALGVRSAMQENEREEDVKYSEIEITHPPDDPQGSSSSSVDLSRNAVSRKEDSNKLDEYRSKVEEFRMNHQYYKAYTLRSTFDLIKSESPTQSELEFIKSNASSEIQSSISHQYDQFVEIISVSKKIPDEFEACVTHFKSCLQEAASTKYTEFENQFMTFYENWVESISEDIKEFDVAQFIRNLEENLGSESLKLDPSETELGKYRELLSIGHQFSLILANCTDFANEHGDQILKQFEIEDCLLQFATNKENFKEQLNTVDLNNLKANVSALSNSINQIINKEDTSLVDQVSDVNTSEDLEKFIKITQEFLNSSRPKLTIRFGETPIECVLDNFNFQISFDDLEGAKSVLKRAIREHEEQVLFMKELQTSYTKYSENLKKADSFISPKHGTILSSCLDTFRLGKEDMSREAEGMPPVNDQLRNLKTKLDERSTSIESLLQNPTIRSIQELQDHLNIQVEVFKAQKGLLCCWKEWDQPTLKEMDEHINALGKLKDEFTFYDSSGNKRPRKLDSTLYSEIQLGRVKSLRYRRDVEDKLREAHSCFNKLARDFLVINDAKPPIDNLYVIAYKMVKSIPQVPILVQGVESTLQNIVPLLNELSNFKGVQSQKDSCGVFDPYTLDTTLTDKTQGGMNKFFRTTFGVISRKGLLEASLKERMESCIDELLSIHDMSDLDEAARPGYDKHLRMQFKFMNCLSLILSRLDTRILVKKILSSNSAGELLINLNKLSRVRGWKVLLQLCLLLLFKDDEKYSNYFRDELRKFFEGRSESEALNSFLDDPQGTSLRRLVGVRPGLDSKAWRRFSSGIVPALEGLIKEHVSKVQESAGVLKKHFAQWNEFRELFPFEAQVKQISNLKFSTPEEFQLGMNYYSQIKKFEGQWTRISEAVDEYFKLAFAKFYYASLHRAKACNEYLDSVKEMKECLQRLSLDNAEQIEDEIRAKIQKMPVYKLDDEVLDSKSEILREDFAMRELFGDAES